MEFGAVAIILILRKRFSKNSYTLFIGGFIVGSIVEYLVSFFGELILNVKWWDYSNRFLNINGRICFMYSIFWGILGLYLIKGINPKIDKFIDWLKSKINIKILAGFTYLVMIFLIFDGVLSAYAINVFLVKVSMEQDLEVSNQDEVEKLYYRIYENEKEAELIEKYFSTDTMLKTYPNLTVTLEDGTSQKIAEFYPDCKTYLYKSDKHLQKSV
jgi:uncharacterized membrane protein